MWKGASFGKVSVLQRFPFLNAYHLDIIKEMLGLINTRVSAQQLYINFTALMINSSSQLDVLSQVEGDHPSQIEGLPSWVPDYSVPLSGNLLCGNSFNATAFLFKMASNDHQGEEASFGLAPVL